MFHGYFRPPPCCEAKMRAQWARERKFDRPIEGSFSEDISIDSNLTITHKLDQGFVEAIRIRLFSKQSACQNGTRPERAHDDVELDWQLNYEACRQYKTGMCRPRVKC